MAVVRQSLGDDIDRQALDSLVDLVASGQALALVSEGRECVSRGLQLRREALIPRAYLLGDLAVRPF